NEIHFSTYARVDESISTDQHIAFLDADKISFPLILRKRRQSDYFYPLGMMKKKKVSRFLSDKKLSPVDKEKVWLIEMDKKLIWVVGIRIDERFKVTESTKQVLKIQLFNTSGKSA
ncbi:MAG: tRNA lysidine(34) synthetase TilS, partial [Chitinophagaceae bacterium]